MRCRRILALCLILVLGPAPSSALAPSLGDRVVAFCLTHLGQRVGNGECAGLAFQALKAAGARPRTGPDYPNRGDYVWGTPVLVVGIQDGSAVRVGTYSDVQPGDVIQFRDVRIGRFHAAHHTAVVESIDSQSGLINAFAQNGGGRRFVFRVSYQLGKLSAGWVRIYRPVQRGA